MNCRQSMQIIDDHLERHGSITDSILTDHTELRDHLDSCQQCASYWNQVAKPLSMARSIPSPPLPNHLKQSIADQHFKKHPFFSLSMKLATVSAVCILCFIAGYMMKSPGNQPEISPVIYDNITTESCRFYPPPGIQLAGFYHSAEPVLRSVTMPDESHFQLPSNLNARGQFQLDIKQIKLSEKEACVGFFSPTGNTLVLHLTKTDDIVETPEYRITSDPQRVLSYTVTWQSGPWQCSITGRLPPDYLLDYARELDVMV